MSLLNGQTKEALCLGECYGASTILDLLSGIRGAPPCILLLTRE